MKSIISSEKTSRVWLVVTFCLTFMLSGCTLSGIDEEVNNDITEEDLEAASFILGESLSDDNSGIVSSLNDAVTTVSENGFVRTSAKGTGEEEDNSGRGRETHITYTYDPETGIHTLTFNREITRSEFTKSVTDTLKYIFTDINGSFISSPRHQRERVETIDFKGKRDGFVDTPNKNSIFSRRDTFYIDGVSSATDILGIDGVHHGQGNMETHKDNGELLARSYELTVNFLNIQIDKSVVQENGNLEQGVTGTLSWEMFIEKQNNGNNEIKTIRGTVEMNGDGTALLRFQNFAKLFQIRLTDGGVYDQSKEFEGNVESVNLERRTFKLHSGRTVRVTEDTEINPDGDLTTFNQIAASLEDGVTVRAGGSGYMDGDVFVATRVTFVTKHTDEIEKVRFEAFISDAKPDHGQIILNDERVIQLTDHTEIDESGDLHSVGGVKEALELGYDVITDGYGKETDEEGISLIATKIRFDKKEGDDFEETAKVEFEDLTTEVNPDAGTVTLEDGTVVLVTDDTDFADTTDFETLGGVKEALEADQAVITSGKGEETDEEGIDIIATFIRFTEQN